MPPEDEALRLDHGNILKRFESRTEDFFLRFPVVVFWRLILERSVLELAVDEDGSVELETRDE